MMFEKSRFYASFRKFFDTLDFNKKNFGNHDFSKKNSKNLAISQNCPKISIS